MAIFQITHISVYVEDQDQARQWYIEKLGFEVVRDDSGFIPDFRWLTIAPKGNEATQFVLMPAVDEAEQSRVGTNAMTVLATDNCREDYADLLSKGVEGVDAPSELPWGISAIIKDLYGNPYNLVQAHKE